MLLRALNVYGDKPWAVGETPLITAMGFFNVTKYPPSLLFIALTLGIGLLLRAFERRGQAPWLVTLAVYGAASGEEIEKAMKEPAAYLQRAAEAFFRTWQESGT